MLPYVPSEEDEDFEKQRQDQVEFGLMGAELRIVRRSAGMDGFCLCLQTVQCIRKLLHRSIIAAHAGPSSQRFAHILLLCFQIDACKQPLRGRKCCVM